MRAIRIPLDRPSLANPVTTTSKAAFMTTPFDENVWRANVAQAPMGYARASGAASNVRGVLSA